MRRVYESWSNYRILCKLWFVLSAEALCDAIRKLGHECELINTSIRGIKLYKYYIGKFVDSFAPDSLMEKVADKINAFNIYRSLKGDVKQLKISPAGFNVSKLSRRYDCVVIGSDILWAVTNPCMGFVPAYFGEGIDCPHFTYATICVNVGTSIRPGGKKNDSGIERVYQAFGAG